MRKTVWFICALLFAGAPLLAAPFDDFEQPSTWFVHDGQNRGGSFSYAAAPEPKKLSGKLSWTEKHFRFLELHCQSPKPLPPFTQELNGSVSVMVYRDANNPATRLNLRLLDAHNEVYQWSSNISQQCAGWQKITYRVLPETANGSWGGDNNKKVELPVRLLGFAVDFDGNNPRAGSLYLDDITASGTGRKVETKRALWRFDREARWGIAGGDRDLITLQPEASSLLLTCAPAQKNAIAALTERYFNITTQGNPHTLRLHCQLLSGSGASFSIRVKDSQGEIFPLKGQRLIPGENALTWNLPADISGQSWGNNRDGKIDAPILFHELLFSREPGSEPVQIRLRSAEAEESVSFLESVRAAVETGNPIHVLKRGEESKLALRLTSTAQEPVSFHLNGYLESFDGTKLPFAQDCSLAAGATQECKLPKPPSLGIWWVYYTLTDPAEGSEVNNRLAFSYMIPAGPTPGKAQGFLFSICTHTEGWSVADAEREALACALCGAKVIRTGPSWDGIQPDANTWNWTNADRIVDLYARQGMELEMLFAYCPGWAVANPAALAKGWEYYKGQCPRLDAWRRYVSALAKRYNGKIRYWEVWNEPDIGFWTGTLDEYLQLLQASYEEVKRVNPQMHVMTGGFAIYERNPSFIEGVVARGQQWFDIFAYHRHGSFGPFQRDVDGPIAALRKKMPTKPIYFNETAVTSTGDTQRYQAETLVKKLMFAWGRGAMGYTWYDLRNDGFNPNDAEHNYGMLTNDFYPKAVYPAYNTLALNFSNKHYGGELPLGPDRYGFFFNGKGETIIAAWSEIPGNSENHLVLKTDAQRAYAMDIMGNRAPLPVVGGNVVLTVANTPRYLVLQGAKKAPVLRGSLAAIPGLYTAVPGRQLRVTASLYNPFPARRQFSLRWEAPEGWQLQAGANSITLAPNARGNAACVLTMPASMKARYGEERQVKLTYRVAGSPWAGTTTAPLHVAVAVPSGDAAREPEFTLTERGQVVNLFENDPNSAHRTWKGPEDLSARIWLGRADGALKLRVAVRDDLFNQPEKGQDSFKGDGIQLAFQFPGQAGYWELGLSRRADGAPDVCCWATPNGAVDPSARVKLQTTPGDHELLYEASFPYGAFGISDKTLESGFQFNLIVNDNDGEGRDGWIQISRGIGDSKEPSLFPFVLFQP